MRFDIVIDNHFLFVASVLALTLAVLVLTWRSE